jgi:hypothetical protein
MSIRNPVLFGLKVAFNFADAESKIECLTNLGLDIRDLDVIRGINNSVVKLDLQNVSGLDVNLTRYLDRLKSDTSLYAGIINNVGGYQYTLQGNLEAFGPLSGGAVRYQYIPSDKGTGLTKSDLKYGDISTSRVSSWSGSDPDETNEDQAISYGASVQVKNAVKLGQRAGWGGPGSTEAIINVLDTPEPIRFPTEVATDVLEIEFNGSARYIYAMRGIPIIFTTAFKNIAMDFEFVTISTGNPIFTLQATDKSESEIQSTPSTSGNVSRLRYNGPSYKERFVKLYYPPNNITGITAASLNIRNLPRVKFFNLTQISVNNNLLGEMPDWRNITYDYNRVTPTNAPETTLTSINISTNPLSQTDDENLQQFGTDVIERLPKKLITLSASGTYNAHTTFKLLNESCVIISSQAEYLNIIVDPTITQTFSFTQTLSTGSGASAETTYIEGYYWDKQVHPVSTDYLVYIKEPVITKDSTWTSSDLETESEWRNAIINGNLDNYNAYFKPLNLASRCPNLQSFTMRQGSGRRIYKNSNTKGPVPSGPEANISYQTSTEYTPTVDLKSIRTYDVYDNSYTKLADIFKSPGTYISGSSTLRTFNVGSNEALSEVADSIDFAKMTNVSSIQISDTGLPIPSGLGGNTSLSSLSCSYTRFPSRSSSTVPTAYQISHPDGGYVDGDGNGNPSNRTNHLFNNKFPTLESEYELNGCSSLSSLSFYNSRLDGMIPKFLGNGNLSSIDFSNTSIEGGRPKDPSSSLSGRRYVMWDDTFEDAQNIKTIRIRSGSLGKNIGIYNSATQKYTEASFEGATFNLPLLETIDIVSTNKLLRGPFFNTSGAPNLKYLYSASSGWGEDLPLGAPVPSFASNPNLIEVDLSGNNFSGQIVLFNANKLKKFYLQNNQVEGIDLNNFSGLNSLEYFIVSNNQMEGQFPSFSASAPNIQYISFANNQYGNPQSNGVAVYTPGLLSNCTRLRSLDMSQNSMSSQLVDEILLDMVANYNNAPRTGVVVNLTSNSAPSSVPVTTPTTTTTTNNEIFTVSQRDPFLLRTLFIRTNDFTINLQDGVSPLDPNFSFDTKVKQNGVDITSTLNIDYASDTIEWVGGAFPPDGATIEILVTTVQQGTITTITGGVKTAEQLKNLGWIVRTD